MASQQQRAKNPSGRGAGLLLAAGSSFLFGAQALSISAASAAGMGRGTIILLRGALVTLFSLIACLILGRSLRLRREQAGKMIIYALFGSVTTSLMLILAYSYLGTGVATTIHFLYPLLVVSANAVLFREKLPVPVWIALGVVLAAIWVMQGISGALPLWGVGAALLSACSWAFGMIYYERSGLSALPPQVVSFYLYLFHTLFGGCYALLMGETVLPAITDSWYLAVLPAVFLFAAMVLFQLGIRRVGTGLSSILGVGEPVCTLLLGYLLLGETMTLRTLLCCIVLLLAILFVIIWGCVRQRETPRITDGP